MPPEPESSFDAMQAEHALGSAGCSLEAMAAPPALFPTNGAAARNGHDRVNVLLVDDREDKLLAIEAILEPLGQNLVRANSGKQALRLLLKEDFAVILMDVAMPGMDGFETAALIRQRPSSEHTPIIFITSVGASPSQVHQGYSLGAVDYVLTPIVPEVLRTKVGVFVELWKKTERIKDQAERLQRAREAEHERRLSAVAERLDAETRRNRFFTLALDLLGIAGFDGRLLQVNPCWQGVLGYSEGELRRLTFCDLAHPEERPLLEKKLRELIQGDAIACFEGRCARKDGAFRWLSWTAAAFPEEKLLYLFGRDITARRENEDQIRRLNAELERRVAALTEVNQELQTFNYSISHDLRAPLRSMAGFAETLLEQESDHLGPHGLDYARRIVRSAKFMDELLRDLLEYSQIARAELRLKPVDLEDAISPVIALREAEFQERSARVDIQRPLAPVLAHLPTLQQILANLIDNSLKFVRPDRPPHLRIFTTREADCVRVWVADNGIGIAPEYQHKIFGLFERLHPTQAFPGTGIGLAIVRKAAERMDGRVGLESEPGSGSRFWVELSPAPVSEPSEPPSLSQAGCQPAPAMA